MKINIKKVLQESAYFYKENFKKLAGVSFALFVFIMYTQCYAQILNAFNDSPALLPLFSLVQLAIMIAALIALPKLHLTMTILINSLLDEKEVIFKEAYRQTKGKYWTYMGYIFFVILCMAPLGVLLAKDIPYVGVISSIYSAFITSIFYTLTPKLAIEPKINGYLKKSKQMIKGNYKAALILTLITTTFINIVSTILRTVFQGKAAALLIIGLLYSIAYFFIYPFASTAAVVVYRKLSRNDNHPD